MPRFDGVELIKRFVFMVCGVGLAAVAVGLLLAMAWGATVYSGRSMRAVDSGEKPQHGIALRV